jgi:hypothetical protein
MGKIVSLRQGLALVSAALVGAGAIVLSLGTASVAAGSDAAVERTRQEVKMLDDLFKTAVVYITEHYVKDASQPEFSAAVTSKALFAAMKGKGWYDVRLVGLTDTLYNEDDKPNDAFEKASAKKLLGGATWSEEVTEKAGKRYLRVATAIPVVMEKCTMCHENFKGNKGNVGALSYTVPLIE